MNLITEATKEFLAFLNLLHKLLLDEKEKKTAKTGRDDDKRDERKVCILINLLFFLLKNFKINVILSANFR